jgi:hypothetical protein
MVRQVRRPRRSSKWVTSSSYLRVWQLECDDAVLDGEADEAGDIVDVELVHDAHTVRVNCLRREEKVIGDVGVAAALNQELQHFAFAFNEEGQ